MLQQLDTRRCGHGRICVFFIERGCVVAATKHELACDVQFRLSQAKSNVDFLSQHADPVSGLVSFGYYGDWLAAEVSELSMSASLFKLFQQLRSD